METKILMSYSYRQKGSVVEILLKKTVMKKIVLFIMMAVFVTGCNISGSSSGSTKEENEDLVIFDEPSNIIETKSFKVFQVLEKGYALAKGLSNTKYGWYDGPIYLLKDDSHYFVDEEIFKAPKGKVFRQTGVYSYTTRGGKVFGTEIPPDKKTVAVIALFDK